MVVVNKEEIVKKGNSEYSDDDIKKDIDWDNTTPEKAYEIYLKSILFLIQTGTTLKMLREGKKK